MTIFYTIYTLGFVVCFYKIVAFVYRDEGKIKWHDVVLGAVISLGWPFVLYKYLELFWRMK